MKDISIFLHQHSTNNLFLVILFPFLVFTNITTLLKIPHTFTQTIHRCTKRKNFFKFNNNNSNILKSFFNNKTSQITDFIELNYNYPITNATQIHINHTQPHINTIQSFFIQYPVSKYFTKQQTKTTNHISFIYLKQWGSKSGPYPFNAASLPLKSHVVVAW